MIIYKVDHYKVSRTFLLFFVSHFYQLTQVDSLRVLHIISTFPSRRHPHIVFLIQFFANLFFKLLIWYTTWLADNVGLLGQVWCGRISSTSLSAWQHCFVKAVVYSEEVCSTIQGRVGIVQAWYYKCPHHLHSVVSSRWCHNGFFSDKIPWKRGITLVPGFISWKFIFDLEITGGHFVFALKNPPKDTKVAPGWFLRRTSPRTRINHKTSSIPQNTLELKNAIWQPDYMIDVVFHSQNSCFSRMSRLISRL